MSDPVTIGSPLADLAAQINQADAEDGASEAPQNPLHAEEYRFDFEHTTKSGRRFGGTFVSVIPDMGTLGKIGVLAARLAGGAKFDTLPPETQDLLGALASCQLCLRVESRPDWAQSLDRIHHPEVVYALYEEVQRHQAAYFRHETGEERGGATRSIIDFDD